MPDDRNNRNIKDILDLIKENPTATSVGSIDGTFEFSFRNESAGGLVFEREEEEAVPETTDADLTPAPLSDSEKPKDKPKANEEKPKEDEFSLPESFTVNEKYDTPATPDTPTKIWTTYVPRFTEVSDTYRMSDDKRPRPTDEPKAEKKVAMPKEQVKAPTPADKEDPTAEIHTAPKEQIVVNLGGGELTGEGDTLKVFKFSEREEPLKITRERTADDERADLKRLITPEEPEVPEVNESAPDPTPDPEPTPPPVADEPKKNAPMTIPDPDESAISVIDYSTASAPAATYTHEAPEGIADNDAPISKKRSGEFTHQLQRDSFKDSFLDSRMSVRIRAVSAALIALMLLAVENLYLIGVNVAELLHVTVMPAALAIIDLQFAVCLYILAAPEIIRAFKYLFRGKLLPELLPTVGLLSLVAYTAVIVIDAPISYPLYGFVYAVGVLAVILSASYRINADFTAFKLISKNSEKRFIDKKLTRTLTEENMALDGAVDEYNSSTARLFRTAFVTDFFKNTAKCAESTAHSLVLLFVPLGTAIVTALVSFFLPGGTLLSAASAFTLTILASTPAASVINHKIVYADSQSIAEKEKSTAVGESAYLYYSGVDVITFRDTEIFGTDDVNLKRFMLYGDRDSMDKAMRQMASLFAVVGGPLDHIFSNALEKRSHPASNPVIELDGLSGDVDGRRIAAGTEEYMLRHGVRIPDGAVKQESGGIDTTKVMYASENGEVYAKFYIRYSFSEEFTSILPELKANGIFPLIYTRDPNVSNELLKTLSAGADCMRVMKRLLPGTDDDPLYRRVSAGMVTYGDKLSTINMILLAKRYRKISRLFEKLEIASMGVGAVVSAVLSLALSTPLPSIVYAAWQILVAISLRVASKLLLGSASERKN